jgi:hypothetical protein
VNSYPATIPLMPKFANDANALPPVNEKKPTWRHTLRYSTTSAYSSTGLPAMLACPSFSHPNQPILKPAINLAYFYNPKIKREGALCNILGFFSPSSREMPNYPVFGRISNVLRAFPFATSR